VEDDEGWKEEGKKGRLRTEFLVGERLFGVGGVREIGRHGYSCMGRWKARGRKASSESRLGSSRPANHDLIQL
jgi:hypothetical protein